jgi:hypothetical protein
VLLISPRPEVDGQGHPVGYIDHRVSGQALVQAVENLGSELVKVDILQPPTFTAMTAALQRASEPKMTPTRLSILMAMGCMTGGWGWGRLCFEDPAAIARSWGNGCCKLIHAPELAAELQHYGVPLMYLDACQTAQATADPKASVAAKLLEEGVGSVVAMGHSVLVETARRFVEPFYKHPGGGQTGGGCDAGGSSRSLR